MRTQRTIIFAAILWCGILFQAFTLPAWVESFGTRTPYSDRQYLTGFAQQERTDLDSEVLEAVKTGALDDLIRQIRVQVKSSVTTETVDTMDDSSSSIAIVSQSISDIKLANVDFLIEKDYRNYYALAYVNRAKLKNHYIDKGRELLERIIAKYNLAETQEQTGEVGPALETYLNILPVFPELMEYRAVYQTLEESSGYRSTDTSFFSTAGIPELTTLSSVIELEKEVQSAVSRLQKSSTPTFEAALDKIAVIFSVQGVKKGDLTVPALLYKSTDFSSAFGQYAGRQLATVLTNRLPAGGAKTVIRGTYWERENDIELYLLAQTVDTGKQIGAATVSFPKTGLPEGFDIKPNNFAQAMEDQLQFAQGAVSDGGLTVEVWTNKGRNEENLVFTEGDELALYFRVNQPAFLQLTYNLATGQKVLLEKSFYIGMDKVNRVVELPYRFEVVPPLGVERLIVTAFSEEPAPPNTSIAYIEGEQYEVFDDTKAVVARTRGLKKKQSETEEASVRVGEAMVTLTTVPPAK